jgi:hypothetical protein
MQAAAMAVTQIHLDCISNLGVSKTLIAEMGAKFPPIGVLKAKANADGVTYTPGHGTLHLALPIIEAGEIIDIIAFHPFRPNSWMLRTALGWALGPDCLEKRWGDARAIELHDTPLNWLRYGGNGLCITNWKSPELRKLLEVERFEVVNAALGRVLIEVLSKSVRLPVIDHRSVLHVA